MNLRSSSKEQQLINAAENGTTHIVKALLNEEDIDINATNKKNIFSTQKTALMLAAKNGHEKVVTTLLNEGYKKKIHCFAIGQGEKIILYDFKDEKEIYRFYNDNNDDYWAGKLALSPNGEKLAVVWEYNTFMLDKKKCILSLYNVNLSESDKEKIERFNVLQISSKEKVEINSIAFSPSGKTLAVGYGDKEESKEEEAYIQLYDV